MNDLFQKAAEKLGWPISCSGFTCMSQSDAFKKLRAAGFLPSVTPCLPHPIEYDFRHPAVFGRAILAAKLEIELTSDDGWQVNLGSNMNIYFTDAELGIAITKCVEAKK